MNIKKCLLIILVIILEVFILFYIKKSYEKINDLSLMLEQLQFEEVLSEESNN